ncbi:GNAT family N-acetyltransferase [Segatella albensis]|jgi:hypothetical protein|uniref:GNAT family N-acetyltransferase n=1 Tax=Segatella albensis TaxID=77768 RepID=UPI0004091DF6|nr:GNAT family N-acetyltransferase [Segatella albensis]
MFEIKRYRKEFEETWNHFVDISKQGTFLFYRNYMDYHEDRFSDYSLLVLHKQRVVALLPANREEHTLWTHAGLTYGGLITSMSVTTANVCDIFTAINEFLKKNGFDKVIYKAIPWIYHRIPAEEDLYALINICNARIIERHISSTIMMENRIKWTESRKSGLRKARHHHIRVEESEDLETFWKILSQNLHEKYHAVPVHSLREIQLLQSRFPQNIKLYLAYQETRPIGGVLIYETPQVVHTQYISASKEGKMLGAIDIIIDYLLNEVYKDWQYFDFGKSSDGDGRALNRNLIFQKEGFGGRGVCYDWYEYTL